MPRLSRSLPRAINQFNSRMYRVVWHLNCCIELGERAKTTLNVPYRLTTEMGECPGVRIVPACPKAKAKYDIKCTLQADHRNGGMWGCENSTSMATLAKTTLNVLYRPWVARTFQKFLDPTMGLKKLCSVLCVQSRWLASCAHKNWNSWKHFIICVQDKPFLT